MYRIVIRVIPNARKNGIEESGGKLKIRVTAPAVDGKANEAVIRELASYLGVKKSVISIIKGEKGRDKIVEVNS